MSSVIDLHTGPGHYMALFHDDGRFLRADGRDEKKFIVYKSISTDGGLTWGQPIAIAHRPDAHLCEPGAIRSPDGKQIAVLLRENSRKKNSFVIVSDDEGANWTEPRELPLIEEVQRTPELIAFEKEVSKREAEYTAEVEKRYRAHLKKLRDPAVVAEYLRGALESR